MTGPIRPAVSTPFVGPAIDVPAFVAPSREDVAQFVAPEFLTGRWAGPNVARPEFAQFQAPTWMDVQNDPGYQFRRDEGNRALNQAQAARGVARSGPALQALSRWNQDYASNEYQQAWQRAVGAHQIGRETTLDRYRTDVDAWNRAFTGHRQNYMQDADAYSRAAQTFGINEQAYQNAWQRAFAGHDWNYRRGEGDWGRAFQTSAYNNQLDADRWNRDFRLWTTQFQQDMANRQFGLSAHNSHLANLFRLYGAGGGYRPTPPPAPPVF